MNKLLMHGYAIYIWPAYTLVFGVLAYNVLRARWRSKQICRSLLQWLNGQ
ncbi:MAG TPA: heme exporter protein CcmD [Legionellaceae bacterium]|nr:heme exporter protein CcmD [Legionellaceae bacterium]